MFDHEGGKHEMVLSNTFRQLKTVCDAVLLNPVHANIVNMMDVIEKSNGLAFQHLSEYAVVPIHYHIHRYNSKEGVISSSSLHDLLICLKSILSKTIINSTKKFILLNRTLVRLLFAKEEFSLDKVLPEEVRFAAVDCIYSLYENLAENVVYEIYKLEKNVNFHAETVYICTQLIRNENLLQTRIMAFQCILIIIRVYGCEQRIILTSELKNNISETVARMFPGIISVCSYIVQSSSLHHRNVYIFSARLFAACVTLIFENTAIGTSKPLTFSNFASKPEADFCVCCNLRTSSFRTNEWYRHAAEELVLRLKNFIPLCNSNQWKVRLEMMKMASLVLSKSSCVIMPVLTKLAEVLIILSGDEIEEVARYAQLHVREIFDTNSVRNEKLKVSLKEQLFHLSESLNSTVNSVDNGLLISQLNLLNGYLEMLDARLVWKSPIYLQNIFCTLKKLVRFDISSVSIDQGIVDINIYSSDNNSSITWKNMKYLSSHTENLLKRIFRTIAKNSDIENLCICLLDLLERDEKNRKEVIYLINNIILSSEAKMFDSSDKMYEIILNIYVDSIYWLVPLPLCNNSDNVNTTSAAVLRNNILQACLLTEGVGNMASCMGRHFKPLLMACLYKIIERAGSANTFLSSVALQTMKKIVQACDYNDIIHLLTVNIDYITYNIYRKLRYLEHDASVLDVFYVITSHCQENSLNIICDLIQILLDSSGAHSDSCCTAIVRILRAFSRKLRSLFTVICDKNFCYPSESIEQYSNFLFTLDNFIHHTVKKGKNFTGETDVGEAEKNLNEKKFTVSDEEEFKNVDQSSTISQEGEVKPPLHIELIIIICEKILHMLPAQNSWNKIIILEIFIDSLLLVCNNEDQLLPLVHKIWSPLVNRLKNDNANYLIMRKCFELLCIMSITAKDFIRTRTLNDILPVIHNFLTLSVRDSMFKEKNSVYRMSQEYKLQYILLRELGPLAVYISLQEGHVQSLLNSVTPYLSSSQPLPLQSACVDTINVVKHSHEDLVRIHLMSIWPQNIVLHVPYSVHFNTIQVKVTETHPDYERNIASLVKIT